jgi:nucleoside permease NupC
VIGGFTLQFFFAALILKWNVGYQIVEFLGQQVQTFLTFTDKGSEFVFGAKYTDHLFAMKVNKTWIKIVMGMYSNVKIRI